MSELILISSVEQVSAVYAANNVNPKRVASVDQKFLSGLPKEFDAKGLIFVTLKIGKKELKNVPAIAINDDGSKYVLVGQFLSAYTDKTVATQIKKEGSKYLDKFMVANNKKVNTFVDGLSEAEVVALVMGKSFKTSNPKDYNVYSGVFDDDGNLSFHDTEKEALAAIKPKSYQTITIK